MCSSPAVYDIVDAGNILNIFGANWEDTDPARPYGISAQYTLGASDEECPRARETTVHFKVRRRD
jgi:hypothetical protein